jgi:hypothetical protein
MRMVQPGYCVCGAKGPCYCAPELILYLQLLPRGASTAIGNSSCAGSPLPYAESVQE